MLGCDVDAIDLQIGDTDLPAASVEGGSSGISSWGRAILAAAQAFRQEHGDDPAVGAATTADAPENDADENYGMYSFGAHFVEARVSRYTGEIHVSRMLGVFSVGRVDQPDDAALPAHRRHDHGPVDGAARGERAATTASATSSPRTWRATTSAATPTSPTSTHLARQRRRALQPDGLARRRRNRHRRRAAAVVNAVYHATGVRVRDLPVTCDKLLDL